MSTEQNAFIRKMKKYYRAMIKRGPHGIYVKHMVSTMNRLLKFHGTESKVVVWEHNTHIERYSRHRHGIEGMVM
jgi:erythromycin esterase-like protein